MGASRTRDKRKRTWPVARLVRMAAERRRPVKYRLSFYATAEDIRRLEHERRLYCALPSMSEVIRQLVNEALGLRRSCRTRSEHQRWQRPEEDKSFYP